MIRERAQGKAALDPFYVDLGLRISQARRRQNRTQEELARALKLTRTSITNVEKGRQKLLIHRVVEIAAELCVPLQDLVPFKGRDTHVLQRLSPERQDLLLKVVPEVQVPSKR